MRFDDPTLYGRDDETDEYSDSGAYGESLEEDLEEEEEEEEEPILVEEDDEIAIPAPVREPAPVTPSGGGEGGPPKKKAPAKKAAKKKAPAKKKAAKKPPKKQPRSRQPRKRPSLPGKKRRRSPPRKWQRRARRKLPARRAAVSGSRWQVAANDGGSPGSRSGFRHFIVIPFSWLSRSQASQS